MGNQTSVTVGALAGSVSVIAWWVISETTVIEAPEAVVAASVVLVTGALQYLLPARRKTKTRVDDDLGV